MSARADPSHPCGQISLTRQRVDPAPIHRSRAVLDGGGGLEVFPAGIGGDGRGRDANPGAGYFALRAGATIVPVAVHGTDRAVRDRGLRRPEVRMIVGPAVPVEGLPAARILPRRTVAVAAEDIGIRPAALVTDTTED